MPKEPQAGEPGAARRDLRTLAFEHVTLPAPVGVVAGRQRHLVRRRARRDDRVRRPVGRRQDDAGQAAGRPVPRRRPAGSSTTASPGTEIDLDALRAQIGFVTQDTQLFSGTIRENLLFVNPAATDAECLDVLRKAACDSLLARADRGLDTVIGEGGVKVSGGEKQRLSIARALLRRPHLLVFDEATSSLDSLTEEGIVDTIREVAAQRRRDHRPHRPPPVDDPARRSHPRPRARPHRRDRTARGAGRAERAVLRDVAAADWRTARRPGRGRIARACPLITSGGCCSRPDSAPRSAWSANTGRNPRGSAPTS